MKVEDIRQYAKIPKTLLDDLAKVIKNLDSCVETYKASTDEILVLEALKREYSGYLAQFTKLVGTVRGYKGTNHIYLEDATRRIRAETIDMLIHDGKNITTAEKLVYSHPYFEQEMPKVEKIRGLFEKVDFLYKTYSAIFQALIQSISVLSKDWTNSNFSGN